MLYEASVFKAICQEFRCSLHKLRYLIKSLTCYWLNGFDWLVGITYLSSLSSAAFWRRSFGSEHSTVGFLKSRDQNIITMRFRSNRWWKIWVIQSFSFLFVYPSNTYWVKVISTNVINRLLPNRWYSKFHWFPGTVCPSLLMFNTSSANNMKGSWLVLISKFYSETFVRQFSSKVCYKFLCCELFSFNQMCNKVSNNGFCRT